MKNKKLSVTIGIPAYNEEANIGKLLKALSKQESRNYRLDFILVISDGSTDRTVEKIKEAKLLNLRIIRLKERTGLNSVENIILKNCSSDVLIILNADVLPENNNLIENLVAPFYKNGNLGIVGGATKSIWPSTFAGKVYANSHLMKQEIFIRINHSSNIYLCHGSIRALSKKFYKILYWPENCPEDAYSYLSCLKSGFDFYYTDNAAVYISPATSFADQLKQSVRYFNGKAILRNFFEPSFLNENYKLPLLYSISTIASFLFRRPILTITFLLFLPFYNGLAIFAKVDHSKYEISKSTKNLNI